MIEQKDTWIQTGYQLFALEGYNAIKVERLAKKVGVSKSSFYHYFADLDTYMEMLLKHHLRQAYVLAEKERNAKNIAPELIDILIEHRLDLLFNRELRVHRTNPQFQEVLHKTSEAVGDSFVLIWLKELNLQLSKSQLAAIFELAIENFFLQINPDTLNREWLTVYFTNLKRIAGNFT